MPCLTRYLDGSFSNYTRKRKQNTVNALWALRRFFASFESSDALTITKLTNRFRELRWAFRDLDEVASTHLINL